MSDDLSTATLEWGKAHRGERIQRIPASYLLWMVRERAGPWQLAQRELDRRGIRPVDVEISGHAIDTASLRIRRIWHQNRRKGEGLHSWLQRTLGEGLELARERGGPRGIQLDDGAIRYLGIRWVVDLEGAWPLLKTVMPDSTPGEPAGPPTSGGS